MISKELISELKKIEEKYPDFFKKRNKTLDDFISLHVNNTVHYTIVDEEIQQWELIKQDLDKLRHKIIEKAL